MAGASIGTTDPFRPPLAGAATWTEVMTAAGWRCECTGECGRPHRKSGDRCPTEHNRGHQLTAAPIDPLTPTAQAVTAPLMAWCAGCANLAHRVAQTTAATTAATDQLDLFGEDAA